MKDIERLAVDTIRTLSMDGVEAARSGHPGTPMALAPVAYVLFNEQLRYDPADPGWPGRDRFVLSCGHASMLLFSLLHLSGVRQSNGDGTPTDEPAVPLASLRQFRQLDSRCPGHPEYGHTSGVEITTGPLGQGVASSVGMAVASGWLAARYNRPGFDLFAGDTYALCSDGDLMEGMSGEAASIAGHLKLANLCWIYDDNKITIEGDTSLAFSEDVGKRFASYGWHVVSVDDANDLEALRGAFRAFHEEDDRPTLIVCRSRIAWGAPNAQDTAGAHGAPLGADEVRLTKQAYGWPNHEPFHVPEEVVAHFREGIGARGREAREAWESKRAAYGREHGELSGELALIRSGDLPAGWDAALPTFEPDAKGAASRATSGKVLNHVGRQIPWLLGGSADLAPSNKTMLTFEPVGSFSALDRSGRNFHFGIREHAMAAMSNGMALCGLRAYAGTFFVFSDYMRASMRLSALMGLPVLYVFTHDSIGVGEDGPTHQPVEHLAALRAIPNLVVIRPADANEVSEAYRLIFSLERSPAALVLTRQNLPTFDRHVFAPASGLCRGGYVLADPDEGSPQVILMASGSEVSLCVEAREKLAAEGIAARVVSMPSWELFDAQPVEYRRGVLPPEVSCRVAVEAGVEQGWSKYTGTHGRFVGMGGFGASAPAKVLFEHFGITVEKIVAEATASLAERGVPTSDG